MEVSTTSYIIKGRVLSRGELSEIYTVNTLVNIMTLKNVFWKTYLVKYSSFSITSITLANINKTPYKIYCNYCAETVNMYSTVNEIQYILIPINRTTPQSHNKADRPAVYEQWLIVNIVFSPE